VTEGAVCWAALISTWGPNAGGGRTSSCALLQARGEVGGGELPHG
jgi:hypothetical protein